MMKVLKSLLIGCTLLGGVAYADCQSDSQLLFEKPKIALKSCSAEWLDNPDDPNTRNNLGQVLFVMGEIELAIALLTPSAEQNNVYAQELLGSLLLNHTNKHNEGIMWLTRASNQGSANAQYNLGYAHQTGEKIEQDYTKAMDWYQKSAKQNNIFAQYGIGFLYEKGLGVKQDSQEAGYWFKKSCDNGFENACEWLK